jgi:hypothetical protein
MVFPLPSISSPRAIHIHRRPRFFQNALQPRIASLIYAPKLIDEFESFYIYILLLLVLDNDFPGLSVYHFHATHLTDYCALNKMQTASIQNSRAIARSRKHCSVAYKVLVTGKRFELQIICLVLYGLPRYMKEHITPDPDLRR